MYVVTQSYNLYDQMGEYFVTAFDHKPSLEELTIVMESADLAAHLLAGGGRIGWGESWYDLYEVTNGERFDKKFL